MQPSESQVRKYGPLSSAVAGLLLTGALLNQHPNTTEKIHVNMDFECNASNLIDARNGSASWTIATLVVFATILPLIPAVLNKNDKFDFLTDDNKNLVVSHVLGQSSNFAGNEFIRHFLKAPDQSFFEKCNLTVSECLQHSFQYLYLSQEIAKNTTTTSFCPQPLTNFTSLYNSLHSTPDIAFSMFGAGTTLFLTSVYLWRKKRNPANPANTVRPSWVKLVLVLCFACALSVAILYQTQTSPNTFSQLLFSFLCGSLMQIFICLLYQYFQFKPIVLP